ncbi:MAG: hypothetical protein RLZZ237_3096, partial [Pseudomonadota bacterium]
MILVTDMMRAIFSLAAILFVESLASMRAVSPAIQLLPLVAALSLAFASTSAFAADSGNGQDDLTAGDEKVMQAVQVTGARAQGLVPTTTEAGSFR